ncbi:sugar ABC transporter ATP-binding protein [Alicyclobacillus suci]|uniref:sugar ABC transporter ATP-binding protein n=1 Tax=Alicyclobacillus suci TaxID=2816080 RepID=UPI001A8D24E7|nr:sugar ABC transporter ATP-binding protein [Alicyclobacillus suci]
MNDSIVLEVDSVDKQYGNNKVLKGISLQIHKNSIHAILGANGAGKSTLVNILSGVTTPTKGTVLFQGRPVAFSSPREARDLGILTMHQELDLMPNLTVWENLFVEKFPGRFGLLNRREAMNLYEEIFVKQMGITIPVLSKLKSLPVSQQQLVYLGKMLTKNAKLIILDEPSASLGEAEQEILHEVMRKLKEQGISMILISHKLDEVVKLCDEITVLRDGTVSGRYNHSNVSVAKLIQSIVGPEAEKQTGHLQDTNHLPSTDEIAYEVEGVTSGPLTDVSLTLKRGRITAVTGLAGAGHEQISLLVSGIVAPTTGRLIFNEEYAPTSVRDAIRKGIVFIHADRKIGGIFPNMSIDENIMMSRLPRRFGMVNRTEVRSKTEELVGRLSIAGYTSRKTIRQLSGGNQQKALIARWLHRDWDILVCAEPTRGVDVSGRREIHNLFKNIVRENPSRAILLSGDDVEEMFEVADTIYVFHDGKITGCFNVRETKLSDVQSAVLGGNHNECETAYHK